MTETDQRAAVVAEARTWLRTPFIMGQASKGYGVDCGLFIAACYRAAGIEVPAAFGLFRHDWHLHTKEERYLNVVEQYTHRVEIPAPGDMVLVRMKPGQPFAHAAVVVTWPHVIHAAWFRTAGRVSELDADRGPATSWEMRFYSPWRLVSP
jgi:cell wall-associated NlpC family hydrolase